jgi:hypothetical protein
MRTLNGLILALVLGLPIPALVIGQTQAPDTRPDPAPAADRDDDGFDWGWLGLLGLAGLFGLKRHDRVDVHDRVTATAHR